MVGAAKKAEAHAAKPKPGNNPIWLMTSAFPADTYSMGAAAGAKVRVHLGERKTSSRTPIVSWTTPPDGVSFAWPDGVAGKGSLVRKEDGLYVVKGSTVIVK